MRNKSINFELRIGDMTITKVLQGGEKFIEVVLLQKPEQKCLFTFDTVHLVNGNIPRQTIPYIVDEVKRNKILLEG